AFSGSITQTSNNPIAVRLHTERTSASGRHQQQAPPIKHHRRSAQEVAKPMATPSTDICLTTRSMNSDCLMPSFELDPQINPCRSDTRASLVDSQPNCVSASSPTGIIKVRERLTYLESP
ncbi:MAG: hypothetical protein WBZ57_05255, partial [Pseudomonas graminis]